MHRQPRHSIILVEGQSIYAGWLGSNHHSQQGQNERMADSLWTGPLPHGRLMRQILGWFMRYPISKRTYHKKSLMSQGTWKQAFFFYLTQVWSMCLFFLHFCERQSRFCHSTIRITLGCVMSFNFICPEWITVIFLCLMLQNILILFKQCRNILRWVQNRATVTRKEALQGFKVLKKEKLFDCQSGD